VIRSYGVEGLRALIRKHVSLARELEGWIKQDQNFEIMAPVILGLVCFRLHPRGAASLDALNAELLNRVNASRRVYLTHTKLAGKYVIRMAVGQRQTELAHLEEAWRLIQQAARELTPAQV
jgi:aromatic-L-amino-acid decarboxylase